MRLSKSKLRVLAKVGQRLGNGRAKVGQRSGRGRARVGQRSGKGRAEVGQGTASSIEHSL